MRLAYRISGFVSLAVGFVGVFLPLLPTVPFVILAAFCFARSNPEWEARLLDHPRFGHHIRAWRTSGAISRKGKAAGVIGFTGSAIMGLYFLAWPWEAVPATIAILGSSWILSRPSF
jgi:hypothetical protein